MIGISNKNSNAKFKVTLLKTIKIYQNMRCHIAENNLLNAIMFYLLNVTYINTRPIINLLQYISLRFCLSRAVFANSKYPTQLLMLLHKLKLKKCLQVFKLLPVNSITRKMLKPFQHSLTEDQNNLDDS
jgi:hypothetical protein